MTTNLDERGRRAAASVRAQSHQTDVSRLYTEVIGRTRPRSRWVAPVAGIAATGAVGVAATVLALQGGPTITVDLPDPLDTPSATEDCSAAGVSRDPAADASLPPATADTRQNLAELAVMCQFDELARIAAADGTTVTFGGTEDPAGLWRSLEDQGEWVFSYKTFFNEPVMEILRVLLDTEPMHLEFVSAGWSGTVWPALAGITPPAAGDAAMGDGIRIEHAKEQLAATGLYSRAEIDALYTGEGWLGWRIGIADDGTWSYFVAGD